MAKAPLPARLGNHIQQRHSPQQARGRPAILPVNASHSCSMNPRLSRLEAGHVLRGAGHTHKEGRVGGGGEGG